MGGKMGGGRWRSSRNRKRIWWVATFFFFFPISCFTFLLSSPVSPTARTQSSDKSKRGNEPAVKHQAAGQIPTFTRDSICNSHYLLFLVQQKRTKGIFNEVIKLTKQYHPLDFCTKKKKVKGLEMIGWPTRSGFPGSFHSVGTLLLQRGSYYFFFPQWLRFLAFFYDRFDPKWRSVRESHWPLSLAPKSSHLCRDKNRRDETHGPKGKRGRRPLLAPYIIRDASYSLSLSSGGWLSSLRAGH